MEAVMDTPTPTPTVPSSSLKLIVNTDIPPIVPRPLHLRGTDSRHFGMGQAVLVFSQGKFT